MKKMKILFVNYSIGGYAGDAVQMVAIAKGLNDKDHEVVIGGSLYSDALGNPGTEEGTYIGMFKYNVNTIVNALK